VRQEKKDLQRNGRRSSGKGWIPRMRIIYRSNLKGRIRKLWTKYTGMPTQAESYLKLNYLNMKVIHFVYVLNPMVNLPQGRKKG
jgi:hypothetical protein